MEEQVFAVQRMQDYIANHVNENITLEALSEEAMFSKWYAHRIFFKFTGLTPFEYIRRLRLSLSALKLRDENVKIADIAFEYGFDSVDGYQRAFLREFGCNPHKYSMEPVPIYLFTPYGVKYRLERKEKEMEKTKAIFIQSVTKPKRKALIKRGIKADGYFQYCDEVGCDIWGLLKSIKSISNEPVCMWLPQKYIAKGTSKYVQGVELDTDYSGPVPEGLDLIDLESCEYLKFQGEKFDDEYFEEAIKEVWSAIEKFDFVSAGYEIDIENPRIQLEPDGKRGYIELVPVKKLN